MTVRVLCRLPIAPSCSLRPLARTYVRDKKTLAERFNFLLSEEASSTVVDGLKKAYNTKLLPLEKHYLFNKFHSPQLHAPDLESLPLVLILGQYSTGKTSLIKHLLKSEYPGSRIGPEPTTDSFNIVSYGEEANKIPGHALVIDQAKQFSPLSKHGSSFLNRLWLSTCPSPVLKGLSVVDTPGILSGEKQRKDRGYDFPGVVEWFAERVDRILLLFDGHKLDISDEFLSCIMALKGNEDKIRIVLNKADFVEQQELMRVYGALMWSLGRVFNNPEVVRVYIGSFWDQPLRYEMNKRLFYAEERDLFADLHSLTRNSTLRKINDMIKRARLAKVHALIMSDIKDRMPMFIGRSNKRQYILDNLPNIWTLIQEEHDVPAGDFPEVAKMRSLLEAMDWTDLPRKNPALIEAVEEMMRNDFADIIRKIPQENPFQEEEEDEDVSKVPKEDK